MHQSCDAMMTRVGRSFISVMSVLKQTNEAITNSGDNIARLKLQQLFIAFSVWRQNMRYNFAASIFGYADHSGVCKCVDRVIEALMKYYVPKYIGYPAWNTDKLMQEYPQFVRTLYPNKIIGGVVDVTYCHDMYQELLMPTKQHGDHVLSQSNT